MTSIVLSGGGVRGFAHAGFLNVIHDSIKIKEVVGCSMGALIGVLYCAKQDVNSMMDFVLKVKSLEVFAPSFSSKGLINGSKLVSKILKFANVNTFDDLQIPLICNSTNIRNGEEVVFDSGRLDKALMATSAYPGMFVPVNYGSKILIDGGITDPFPIKHATQKRIIGVNVSYGLGLPEAYNSTDILKQCINVLQMRLAQDQLHNEKALIIKPNLHNVGVFDVRKKLYCIRAGARAANASALAKLK